MEKHTLEVALVWKYKGEGKGHPRTGKEDPKGGVEVEV
jgi:hypothetical protein